MPMARACRRAALPVDLARWMLRRPASSDCMMAYPERKQDRCPSGAFAPQTTRQKIGALNVVLSPSVCRIGRCSSSHLSSRCISPRPWLNRWRILAAQYRADPHRRRGRRQPPVHAQDQSAYREPRCGVRQFLRQLCVLLPFARLDPARAVRPQYPDRRQRAALRRLREAAPARAREVDRRDLAAGRGLPHRAGRQIHQPLHPRDRRRAARVERLVRRRQRPSELRLHAQRERSDRGLRPRARRLSERRADRQGGRGDRELGRSGPAVLSLRGDLHAAQPGGIAAAPQGSVRRCRAAAAAGVRRGRHRATSPR